MGSALLYGMYQFATGRNQQQSNMAMRWRVGLQAGGVLALFGWHYFSEVRNRPGAKVF